MSFFWFFLSRIQFPTIFDLEYPFPKRISSPGYFNNPNGEFFLQKKIIGKLNDLTLNWSQTYQSFEKIPKFYLTKSCHVLHLENWLTFDRTFKFCTFVPRCWLGSMGLILVWTCSKTEDTVMNRYHFAILTFVWKDWVIQNQTESDQFFDELVRKFSSSYLPFRRPYHFPNSENTKKGKRKKPIWYERNEIEILNEKMKRK